AHEHDARARTKSVVHTALQTHPFLAAHLKIREDLAWDDHVPNPMTGRCQPRLRRSPLANRPWPRRRWLPFASHRLHRATVAYHAEHPRPILGPEPPGGPSRRKPPERPSRPAPRPTLHMPALSHPDTSLQRPARGSEQGGGDPEGLPAPILPRQEPFEL